MPSLIEIGSLVMEIKLKNFVKVFLLFFFISPWKMVRYFIWTNLSPLQRRMHCANLAKFGPVVLEKIFKFHLCIFAILLISYIGEVESLPKDNLCKVW